MLETIRRSNMKKIISELVDIEEYLDSIGIEYTHPGSKNTGRESISISCPFCGDHEYSGNNHLGIKMDTKVWNCWICSARGSLIKLAMRLEGCDYNDAIEHLRPFMNIDPSTLQDNDSEVRQPTRKVELPGVATLLDSHHNYLEGRNFDPEYIFRKYKLNCVGPIGRWRHSLIIPYFNNGRIITFSGADITGTSDTKYRYLSNEQSVNPIGKTLYNIDNAIDTALVVEGVTDVWRVGDGAVALGRKKYTTWQIKRLSKFKRVFIMLDSDAHEMAEELAHDLGMFTEVVLYELDEGDPCDLSPYDIALLRKEIF
jgi:DNA primase